MKAGRLIFAIGLLAPSLAFGQGMLGRGSGVRHQDDPAANRREAPQGLPGIAARRGLQPIPPDANPAGMNPNDALFDGINRGDLATVRDAIARGADVNARNALGLTALDSAVDQGRPEVTFYLLSVRGTGSAPSPAALPERTTRAPAPTREARRGRDREPAPQVGQAAPRARIWAGDGGAPRPDVGFLGFDAGRPVGAEDPARRRG